MRRTVHVPGYQWIAEQYDCGVHIYPIDDLVMHEMDDAGELACACLPVVEPVIDDDKVYGFLIVHNAWDGRV